jgi:hypothetical protein
MYADKLYNQARSPILGLKLSWVSETLWEDFAIILSMQILGAVASQHEATESGTKMTDVVHYACTFRLHWSHNEHFGR